MVTNGTLNDVSTVAEIRRTAIAAIELWLVGYGATCLSAKECKGFDRALYTHGWRIELPVNGSHQEIAILVDFQFPFRQPDMFALGEPLFGLVPHVELDGYICALSSVAVVDSTKPVPSLKATLNAVKKVLSCEYSTGDTNSEFRREFLSYWRSSVGSIPIRSILSTNQRIGEISVWYGKKFTLVADSDSEAIDWLLKFGVKTTNPKPSFDVGLLVPLQKPLVPSEFPENSADVLEIVSNSGDAAKTALQLAICNRARKLILIFLVETDSGGAFFGVKLDHTVVQKRGPHKTAVNIVTKGFRPDKVPLKIEQSRLLGKSDVEKLRVDRFDANWVHGRGHVAAIDELREKHVLVVGCGSVGASVALLLARSGIGSFTLVDPEVLDASNVGRHALGVANVGISKAHGLKRLLESQFPHLKLVAAQTSRIETVLQKMPDLLNDISIVLCAVGDWKVEGHVNRILLESVAKPDIVVAWTEPFAAAGHAVVIKERFPSCIACGLDIFGTPKLSVSQWPKLPLLQEPACGTMFLPYGPIELTHIHALVAQAVLDALIGKIEIEDSHRIWCGSKNLVLDNGGAWTDDWEKLAYKNPAGGFLQKRSWPLNPNCLHCRGA